MVRCPVSTLVVIRSYCNPACVYNECILYTFSLLMEHRVNISCTLSSSQLEMLSTATQEHVSEILCAQSASLCSSSDRKSAVRYNTTFKVMVKASSVVVEGAVKTAPVNVCLVTHETQDIILR